MHGMRMVVSQNTVVTGTRLGKERYRLCGFVAYTLGFYFNYYSICTFLTPYIYILGRLSTTETPPLPLLPVSRKQIRFMLYSPKKNNLVDCHSNNFSLRMLQICHRCLQIYQDLDLNVMYLQCGLLHLLFHNHLCINV